MVFTSHVEIYMYNDPYRTPVIECITYDNYITCGIYSVYIQ